MCVTLTRMSINECKTFKYNTILIFQVFVTMDPFILSTEESVTVSIGSFYGSEKTVRGNTTVRMYGSYWGNNPRRKDWQFITAREFFLVG